jgi:quinol monooxygenase YgiN
MSYAVYQIGLPEHPEAVVFINGFVARDRAGFFWMWKHLLWIRNVTVRAQGCLQVKAGICSPNEVVMVSYWNSKASLRAFFQNKSHREMMQFVAKNPQSLCLYNETYSPSQSGKYSNERQGMALIYQ